MTGRQHPAEGDFLLQDSETHCLTYRGELAPKSNTSYQTSLIRANHSNAKHLPRSPLSQSLSCWDSSMVTLLSLQPPPAQSGQYPLLSLGPPLPILASLLIHSPGPVTCMDPDAQGYY